MFHYEEPAEDRASAEEPGVQPGYSRFLWRFFGLGSLLARRVEPREGEDPQEARRWRSTGFDVVKNLVPPSRAGYWIIADEPYDPDVDVWEWAEDETDGFEKYVRRLRRKALPGSEDGIAFARVKDNMPEGVFDIESSETRKFVISSSSWQN